MEKFAIAHRQLLKVLWSVVILLHILGCTSTYKIEYSVTSSDPSGINSADLKAISESLLSDPNIVPTIANRENPSDITQRFYLSRHIDAHEILNIEQDNNELILTITRLTKNLGDFSKAWKNYFIRKIKMVIESATKKTVTVSFSSFAQIKHRWVQA